MSNGIYTGVSGVARNITSSYVGVGGVSRAITNGYIGVDGVAREFWNGGEFVVYDRGSNPYNLKSNYSKVASINTDCIHWNEISHVYETTSPALGEPADCVITSSYTFDLANIDNYSELSFIIDTHGNYLSKYNLGVYISSSPSGIFLTSGVTNWYSTIWVSGKTTGNVDGEQEYVISITDTMKSNWSTGYANICNKLSSSAVYFGITCYADAGENSDGEVWNSFKEMDLYRLSFR